MILTHVSASQIRLFRDCKRSWAWAYLAGFKPPETPVQRLGKDVHAVLETYLKTGRIEGDETAIEIAKPGFKYLPPRSPSLLVEQEMELSVGGGLPKLVGVMDLVEPMVRVTDHKTIGNLNYKKKKEDLEEDPQLNIYAEWAFRQWPALELIALRHVYYQTKGARKSAETEVVRRREQVLSVWNEIVETVREMTSIAATYSDALRVDFNTGHCKAFGGCPHLERCGFSTTEMVFESFGDARGGRTDTMKSLEELMKEKGGAPTKARKKGPAILPPDAPVATATMSGNTDTLEVATELASMSTPPAEAEANTTAPMAKPIPKFNLFIDCMPTSQRGKTPANIVWFEHWIEPIAKEVAEENNVVDYRTIRFEASGLISAAMRQALHTIPEGCDLVLGSMLPSAKHAQEVLVPYAENVYRSVRA